SREGAGTPLPVLGWQYQRYQADDVVTMREPGEDDEALRARHMAAVRPLLGKGAVPMFMPINPDDSEEGQKLIELVRTQRESGNEQ
ncbi:MAG: hypothetical protein ABR539_13525, partial [Halomonas sp.]